MKSKVLKNSFQNLSVELKWMKENFSRNDSEQFLENQQVGVFVIRKSESIQNSYVLSVKVPVYVNPSQVSHYVLIKSKNGYHIRGCQKEFKDIEKLINHCSLIRDMLPVQLDLEYYESDKVKQNCVRSTSLNSISSKSSDFSDFSELEITPQRSDIFA